MIHLILKLQINIGKKIYDSFPILPHKMKTANLGTKGIPKLSSDCSIEFL